MNGNETYADYVTVWDGGNTSIYNPCIVDLKTKEIVKILHRKREVFSTDEEICNANVDDMVDVLEREEIRINGNVSPVFEKDMMNETENKEFFWRKEK